MVFHCMRLLNIFQSVTMETSLDITTPAPKTTVGLKRMKMKKKLNLNTSKTKLKSVPATPVNFSCKYGPATQASQ